MSDDLGWFVGRIVLYLTHPATIVRWTAFLLMFAVVVVTLQRHGRSLTRFRRLPFVTDVAYGVWYPVATYLIALPIALVLAPAVTHYVPFLQWRLLEGLPAWLRAVVWLVCSDFTQYWLHRSMHQTRWLWTFHKIHHSQQELNSFTSWRAHWLEIGYVNLGAFAIGVLLGPPVALHLVAVGVFALSQFAQHSDIDWTYGWLGKVIVSPRFHGRHHSTAAEDRNVNFGSTLIVWDRLFGTERQVAGRAPSHGLDPSEDDVPASFFSQQLYPLWRRPKKKAPAADAPGRT